MRDPLKRRYLYLMVAGFGAISLSIVLFFLLYRMQGIGNVIKSLVQILTPFIYGGVVAYLLRPMCNHFETFFGRVLPKRMRKQASSLSIIASLIVMALILYALASMVVPQVYESFITMWNAIPSRVRSFISWADETFGDSEAVDIILQNFNTSYEKLYLELGTWVRDKVVPQVTTVLGDVGSSMFRVLRVFYNLLIGLIVAVYVLASRKRFARQSTLIVRSLLPERWAEAVLSEVTLVDKMFGGFIDAKIVDSAIIGVLCYLGCLILRMPYTLLISVFIGVTNVIPFFGPFIGAIPSTFLILIEDPLKAVWFAIFVLFLQQLDGNVIGPRIMGNRIGISGFWVMFAIILFGGMWGVVGMIVGVPLFAVVYDLIKKLVRRGLMSKEKLEIWEQYEADFPSEHLQPVLEVQEQSWTLSDWMTYLWEQLQSFWTKLKAFFVFCVRVWKTLCKWAKAVWNFLQRCWNKLKQLRKK